MQSMITRGQIMPLLMEACPSFRPIWEQACDEEDTELVYACLGSFARHLLDLHRQKKEYDFFQVGWVIERLIVEGDAETRDIAIIGLLEAIQNVWGNSNVDPEKFYPSLFPKSAEAWNELNLFWQGKLSAKDNTRNVEGKRRKK